ncbi:MAG: hypothetical protein LBR72_07850, partial [Oscillospiraceae bacterium]|nr:hypothetical protein [Oscillospiraceae bacterium]
NKWEQDSVEVFLSETDASAGSYELGDGQYRVNYENTQSFGSQGAVEGFQSAARIVPDRGYDVIMAIPFTTVTPKSGTTIGLDVQVNDRNEEDTQRTSVMIWSDNTGNSYISNTNWGSLTLTEATDDTALEVTPTLSAQTPETSPQNTAETKPDSNHTVAVIIIILALAVAGIAVFIVLRRKKTGKK